ncbi:class I lanthipeptide [Elizabethkingia occulta]|uniref:Uncharacterized protein n=1 Tax=Elizabethkingia occulta TaxID=1867263 RepID=A0A1T3MGY1_9FLAO|nr:class I lanthipeptide [Elizabethkingia occulta]OPB94000.1 hypothetical protein BB020_00980 [Elizabethkingia occulta]OPC63709.1 hypothetical protein BAZ10_06425 [Elizabethkingia occulta]
MKKKKITKLEIRKEDILNLSQDESQQIIGGGGSILTVDFSQCPGNVCDETERCNTNECTEEDCTYGDCTMNPTDDTGCITDITRDCTNGDIWACGTRT